MKNHLINKYFFLYLLKFLGIFCLAYFGTIAVIGLSAPGRFYNSIIDKYFDYVSWLRSSLLYASQGALSIFGYDTQVAGKYLIKLKDGFGVRIVYSCIGYGVMSFWVAFIFANIGNLQKKVLWVCIGLILIFAVNVCRICLLLLATNKLWPVPPVFDHHTWFNITSYIIIFALMYFFDKSTAKRLPVKDIITSRASP